MLRKNTILTGLLVGIIVPYVGWAIWISIFDQLNIFGAASTIGMSESFRPRTTALLAICTNLVPFLYASRNNFYEMMRGIVFPTVVLSIVWLFYFDFI